MASNRRDGQNRHLVYTTGCSVYGSNGAGAVLTEESPCASESWRYRLEQQLATTTIPYTILRPAFIYGGGGQRSLLGQWFAQGEKKDGRYFGQPSKVWSWVHVSDLARAYARVLDDLPDQNGQVYVLADSYRLGALDTFKACLRAAGAATPVEFLPATDGDPEVPIFDQDVVVDSSKAARRLEWRPAHGNLLSDIDLYYRSWLAAKTTWFSPISRN